MPVTGRNQRKVLLMLEAGAALALSGSPKTYFRILRHVKREWQKIEEQAMHAAIRKLYESKLIDARDNPDGTTTAVLTQDGKKKALTYKIDEMEIRKPKSWDGKWRIVIFDIPEKRRKTRDALRQHLHQLGCLELQKSVFVHPFDCRDEIDYLIEFYQIRRSVRFIVADSIDNAMHLKYKFHL